jgi:hypothetical protein
MNLYAIRLDAATYGEETGENMKQGSRRYALTVALGWGSAPPAPIPATPEERKLVVPAKQPVKEVPAPNEVPTSVEPTESQGDL